MVLNITWDMEGILINLNTQISKHLADLGQTLTTLTSEEDEGGDYYDSDLSSSSDDDVLLNAERVRLHLILSSVVTIDCAYLI